MNTQAQSKTSVLFGLLVASVIVLMIMNIGLFIRLNQWQNDITKALEPVKYLIPRPVTSNLPTGSQAPAFNLRNTENQEVSLSDFQGERSLIVFLSTSCSVCQAFKPELIAFAEHYPDYNLILLVDGTEEEVQELAQEMGFPVLMVQNDVAQAYGIPGVPWVFVIDEDGVIIGQGSPSSEEKLEKLANVGA